MPTPAQNLLFRTDDDISARARFIDGIEEAVPNIRVLWLPGKNDATAVRDFSPSYRLITWDGSVSSRLTKQGHGYLQTFNGTTNFASSPDTSDLSFGNAALDSAFSIVALCNVTTSAANREIVAKWTTTSNQREYHLAVVGTSNVISLAMRDENLVVTPNRSSDATISVGALHLFASTYDGTGGATAANGITLYQDAAVIASTASNQATYVAMADKTGPIEIGTLTAGGTPFLGQMGMVMLSAGVLSAAQLLAIKAQTNNYFGLAL